MALSDFMGAYFREGFQCLFDTEDNNAARCDYSFLYLLGYVFSLFVLQLSLTYVSRIVYRNQANFASIPFFVSADEREEHKERKVDFQYDGTSDPRSLPRGTFRRAKHSKD